MRYYKTPWYKKLVKKSCDSFSILHTANKFIKNPVKALINMFIDKGRNIDTKRKQKGYYKNRRQVLNPKTNRWVVFDTKSNKIIRQSKKKWKPYKHIRKG